MAPIGIIDYSKWMKFKGILKEVLALPELVESRPLHIRDYNKIEAQAKRKTSQRIKKETKWEVNKLQYLKYS